MFFRQYIFASLYLKKSQCQYSELYFYVPDMCLYICFDRKAVNRLFHGQSIQDSNDEIVWPQLTAHRLEGHIFDTDLVWSLMNLYI